jgi:hypothetical protein
VSDGLGAEALRSARARLSDLKARGDKALARLTESDLEWAPDPESNSVAVLVQHLAGNMRSRWTDFLTADGEKPDRDRDGEFEAGPGASREALLARWEEGWGHVFRALEELRPEDLTREVVIRGRNTSALNAINAQLVHYGEHVGQILWIAKHRCGDRWESLSVPRRPRV